MTEFREHIKAALGRGGEEAGIMESIEISRSPEEVFSYATDPTNFPAFQEGVVSVRRLDDRPLAVGSETLLTRRAGVPGMPLALVQKTKVSELDAPWRWEVRCVDGPARYVVGGTIEPLDGGERTRMTYSIDFEGHGMGKVLVPLVVVPRARKEVPKSLKTLKDILEQGS